MTKDRRRSCSPAVSEDLRVVDLAPAPAERDFREAREDRLEGRSFSETDVYFPDTYVIQGCLLWRDESTLTPALSQRERERGGTALSQRERERGGTALSQRERERGGSPSPPQLVGAGNRRLRMRVFVNCPTTGQ
jgi:hypothetical protein